MTNEELEKWFWNKFNSCYPVISKNHPKIIMFYYDKKYERKKKLYKLNNKKIELPNNVTGICAFQADTNRKYLYCDFDEIYIFIRDHSNLNGDEFDYDTTARFIDKLLLESDIFSKYTSMSMDLNDDIYIESKYLKVYKNENDRFTIRNLVLG